MQLTEFDKMTMDESLQMAKVLLPYLDLSIQRTFAMMIKLSELLNTIRLYATPNADALSKGPLNQSKILDILGNALPPETKDSINMMQQMMNMEEVMGMMNKPQNEETSPLSSLSSMMDDDQTKLYEEYMQTLDEAFLTQS